MRVLAASLTMIGFAWVLSTGNSLAKDGPPGPDGLPKADRKHPWIFLRGDAKVDTFSFPIPDIVPVACHEFEGDDWVILVRDPGRGLVETKWKQIHHPLIWLFAGKMMARVTVELRPLTPNRTQVVFRGDLASHHSLVGNPILGPAKGAYGKAFHNWRRNVLGALNHRAEKDH